MLGTTAFGDRETKMFDSFLDGPKNDLKSKTYYWGYGTDKAMVDLKLNTCL